MVYKCCVPSCRGNYDPENKVHVFSFPSDEGLRRVWMRAIKRPNFIPTKHSVVCERHFHPNDIKRKTDFSSHDGQQIELPLKIPRLAQGAVPSLLPNREAPEKKKRKRENEQIQAAMQENIYSLNEEFIIKQEADDPVEESVQNSTIKQEADDPVEESVRNLTIKQEADDPVEESVRNSTIKQEADDPVEESVRNSTEFAESSALGNVVDKDDSEEELQPVASVFLEMKHDIKEEVEEEYEDPLAMCGEEIGAAHDVNEPSSWIPGGECSTTSMSPKESTRFTIGLSDSALSGQLSGAGGIVAAVSPANDSSEEGDSNVPAQNIMGEKDFKCSMCRRYFKEKTNLDIHMLTHTGRKPYDCPVCQKSFQKTKCLVVHIRKHTRARPFICSICSKSFCQRAHLDMHMYSHTSEKPYQCAICQKNFKNKTHVLYHLRMHSGEKPYPCTVCSKRFLQKSHLVDHMRTHTGEKPYHCSVCGKQFSLSGNLAKHLRTHRKERLK